MPRTRLTHRSIPSLKAGRWMTDYWDDRLPGFGVRVAQSGRKTFVVRYSGANGRKRRLTLGAYPLLSLADARDRAKEVLSEVVRGEDPQGEKEASRQALTFGELAEVYLERHAKVKKKRWKEDARMLRVDLLPSWKSRPAAGIGRREVSEILDGVVARGAPIMANRVKALISTIYNFGIGRGLVETNPSQGVPLPAKARQRDRVLSDEEMVAVWEALEQEGLIMGATFKMRLLTAQRGSEVLSMRWSDLADGWWTIPAEVAKNGLSHRVPLSPQVLGLLEELRPITGQSEWVFASPRKAGAHITAVQKAAERIVRRCGVEFVPHDLRRTAASFMTSMRVSRLVVSKILNHVESGITAVYDRHSYDGEKREALELWGERLAELLGDGEARTVGER